MLSGMSAAVAVKEAPKEEFDLSPEEEAELEHRFAESEVAEREGALVPWEALFPPRPTSLAG